jgi:hypothetical protein
MTFEGMNNKYAPVITNYAYDSGGNLLVSLIVDDSCRFYGTGNLVYTEPVIKNPGSILVKISPSGTVLWQKQWMPNNYLNDFFYIYDITISSTNDIYISGRFRGSVDVDPGTGVTILNHGNLGGANGFIVKVDQNGNFLWYNRLGEPWVQNTSPSSCQFYEIKELPNNDLICNTKVSGNSLFHNSTSTVPVINSSFFKSNAAFLKISAAGNLIDTTIFGDTSKNLYISNHVLTSTGEVIALFLHNDTLKLSNNTSSALLLTDSNKYRNAIVFLDQNMTYKSHKQAHKNHSINSIKLINNYIYTIGYLNDTATLGNGTFVNALPSYGNIVIEKMDILGNNVWSRYIQGTKYTYPLDFNLYYNYLVVNYEFDSTLYIGGFQSQISTANTDMCNLILDDQNGSTLYNIQLKSDSTSFTWWNKIAIRNNTILFKNYVMGSTTIDSIGIFSSNNPPQDAGHLYEFNLLIPVANQDLEEDKIYLYPNPATNLINIPHTESLKYEIFNPNGKLLLEGILKVGNSIDINSLSSGHYILRTQKGVILFQKSQ